MSDFSVRTAEQLPTLLQAFRKQSGLTQEEVALKLGVTQQTLSALERNADKVGAGRLLELLGILGVELVLRDGASGDGEPGSSTSAADPLGPQW
jgi:HTH-type transcriptional regulator/antitoxin HipB